MDDRFLYEQRRDPQPAFAERLRARLGRVGVVRGMPSLAWKPAFAGLVAVAVGVSVFAFPSVRVSAQAMLDLFRVRNFAAVRVDPARLEALRARQTANKSLLIFDRTERILESGKPVVYSTAQAAGTAAGLVARVPGLLPGGLALERVQLVGEERTRLTLSEPKLRNLLEALDLRDVQVPAGIDQRPVDLHLNPVVVQLFKSDRHEVSFLQARSPEIGLPAGVDLAQLAELGMRIMGVDQTQARRLAKSVDWHTTLLVPVPTNARTFRSVEIHGNPGMLVTAPTYREGDEGAPGSKAAKPRRSRGEETVVMWSEQDRVYGLCGNISEIDLMQMAESVR